MCALQMKGDGTMEHVLGGWGKTCYCLSFSGISSWLCAPCLWALYPISPLLTTYPQGGTGREQYRDKHRCGEPGQAMSLPVVSQGPTSSASPAPCPTAMECCTNTWEAGNPWGWPVSKRQVPLISFLTFNRFY